MRAFSLVTFLLMAVPAKADHVLVSSNQVRVVDVAAREVTATIDLGQSYVREMLVDAGASRAYVAHSRGIAVVDLESFAVLETWGSRPVVDLSFRAGERTLHALEHTPGERYEVVSRALENGEELTRLAVDRRPLDIVTPPGTGRVYTTNHHDGELRAFDDAAGVPALVLLVHDGEDSLRETYIRESLLSPDGERIHVVLNGARAGVVTFGAANGERRGEIRLDHPAYVRDAALSPDGTRLYLAALDHLAVLDLEAGRSIAWVPLGAPHQGVAVSPDGTRVYLANPVAPGPAPAGGTLAVVDAERFEVIDRIPVDGISPFRVAALP